MFRHLHADMLVIALSTSMMIHKPLEIFIGLDLCKGNLLRPKRISTIELLYALQLSNLGP